MAESKTVFENGRAVGRIRIPARKETGFRTSAGRGKRDLAKVWEKRLETPNAQR
jgi:hypothetical protein